MQTVEERLVGKELDHREHTHSKAAKRERQELSRQKRAKRKWQLSKKIDDPALLLACLRFYLAHLVPEVLTPAQPIHARYKHTTRKVKVHLKAARRVLLIKYKENRTLMILPRNAWIERLPRVGLKFHLHPEEKERFEALNADLKIDDALRAFALSYPDFLEKVQLFLSDNYRPGIVEITGKEECPSEQELADMRSASAKHKAGQWWLPPTEEELPQPTKLWDALSTPGPFADKRHYGQVEGLKPDVDPSPGGEHTELLQAVAQEQMVRSGWDNNENDDRNGAYYDDCVEPPGGYAKIRRRILSGGGTPAPYVSPTHSCVSSDCFGEWLEYRNDLPTSQRYPFAPLEEESANRGRVSPTDLLKARVRGFLARRSA
jgi:hypothetical protein